jgi:hypothetical protein
MHLATLMHNSLARPCFRQLVAGANFPLQPRGPLRFCRALLPLHAQPRDDAPWPPFHLPCLSRSVRKHILSPAITLHCAFIVGSLMYDKPFEKTFWTLRL